LKKVKIAFIGAGFIGQLCHIQNYYENKNCEIVGLAETKKKLCNLVAKKYDIPNTFHSHLDLLKSNINIDAVVIVVNRHLTEKIVYDCLKKGINVLTEKPTSLNYSSAKKLVNLSEKKKLIYKVGYNKIYDEGVVLGKKIFDKLYSSNELGKLVFVRAHRYSGTGYCNQFGYFKTNEKIKFKFKDTSPKWLPSKLKNQYLSYLNLYCHNINLLRHFITNEPKIDYANISKLNSGIVILDFKGVKVSIETKDYKDDYWDENFIFYFEKGYLEIKTPPQQLVNYSAKVSLFKRNNSPIKIIPKSKFTWSFKNQADAFINEITKKRCEKNQAKFCLNDMKIIEDIFKRIKD
jgi:predicted dehydrogenase